MTQRLGILPTREHATELERPILQRLLALPGDLLLDVDGDCDCEA